MDFAWFLFPLYAFLYLLSASRWVRVILIKSNITLKNALLNNCSQVGSFSWHFKDSFSILCIYSHSLSFVRGCLSSVLRTSFNCFLTHLFLFSPSLSPQRSFSCVTFFKVILSPKGENIKHIHDIGTMLSNTTDLILTFRGSRDCSMLWPWCFQQKIKYEFRDLIKWLKMDFSWMCTDPHKVHWAMVPLVKVEDEWL